MKGVSFFIEREVGLTMSKTKIFIDAGHNNNGFNTGAVGNGLKEQDITFEVSKLLGDILKNDFEIKLSRGAKETNLGTNNATAINARWKMANEWCADYFISIHCNAFNGQATGAETLYFREDSKEFARIIQCLYSTDIGLRDRGIKYRDNIAVLRNTTMPSILIELAFIDNESDAEVLRMNKSKIAQILANAIFKFLGVSPQATSQSPQEVTEQTKDTQESKETRYQTLEEVPDWGRPTIEKLIALEMLQGNESGLNISEDMLRIFVIHDRAGMYGEIESQNYIEVPTRFTASEIELLEKIVHAEARGEDEKGQILVANVILNRLESPYYPDTVEEVIFQPNQFEPVKNGMIEIAQPQEITKNAVKQAISGQNYSQGALFFRSIKGLEGSWHDMKLEKLFSHGGHTFFR